MKLDWRGLDCATLSQTFETKCVGEIFPGDIFQLLYSLFIVWFDGGEIAKNGSPELKNFLPFQIEYQLNKIQFGIMVLWQHEYIAIRTKL